MCRTDVQSFILLLQSDHYFWYQGTLEHIVSIHLKHSTAIAMICLFFWRILLPRCLVVTLRFTFLLIMLWLFQQRQDKSRVCMTLLHHHLYPSHTVTTLKVNSTIQKYITNFDTVIHLLMWSTCTCTGYPEFSEANYFADQAGVYEIRQSSIKEFSQVMMQVCPILILALFTGINEVGKYMYMWRYLEFRGSLAPNLHMF